MLEKTDVKSLNFKLLGVGLLLALLSFAYKPAALALFLLFPAVLWRNLRRQSPLISIPLGLFLNLSSLILTGVLFTFVQIPLYIITFVLLNVLLNLFFYYKNPKLPDVELDKNAKWMLVGLWGLFGLAFVARVVSVAEFPVPPLHDPVAHAYYVKLIATEHAINFYYSPGLHIPAAVARMATSITSGYAIHMFTNFLNAISPLTWGLSAYLITKKNNFSFLVGLLTFAAAIPAVFFGTTGKNAMIFGIAYLPFVLWLSVLSAKAKTHKWQYMVYALIALLALAFIHFPTFGFGFGFFAAINATALFVNWYKERGVDYKPLAYLGLASLFAVTVVGGWFGIQWQQYQTRIANRVPRAIEQQAEQPSFLTDTSRDVRSYFRGSRITAERYVPNDLSFYSDILMVLVIASVVYLLIRKFTSTSVGLLVYIFAFVGVSLFPAVLNIDRLEILNREGRLFVFQIITPLVAFLIADVIEQLKLDKLRSKLAFGVVGIAIVAVAFLAQWRHFNVAAEALVFVDDTDLKAYEWIESNIPNAQILNDAQNDQLRENIVYATDGALWVPVYTNASIGTPFQQGKFNSAHNNKVYGIYNQLRKGNNPKKQFSKLNELGFNYYYHDKQGGSAKGLDITQYQARFGFELLFENDGVAIYKISL